MSVRALKPLLSSGPIKNEETLHQLNFMVVKPFAAAHVRSKGCNIRQSEELMVREYFKHFLQIVI
jgi:hypothetical protein